MKNKLLNELPKKWTSNLLLLAQQESLKNMSESLDEGKIMKKKLLNELSRKWIPNLSLFVDEKALEVVPELLNELLDEDKKWFQNLLSKKNEDLNFDDIVCTWKFCYLWNILYELSSIQDNLTLRNIILNFMWTYQDFCNEKDYSVDYYNKLVWMYENMNLDDEQKRVLYLSIRAYENRGINLPWETQEKIKKINKELLELWEKFQNNVKDDQSEFSYYFSDDSSIKDLPKPLLEKGKLAAWDKWWYLFDADPNGLIDIVRYCTDPKVRKDIYDIRESWATRWKYDNRENVLQFLKLNDEKAKLMWYQNAWYMFLADKMAKTPDNAKEFISKISKKAYWKAKIEYKRLEEYFWLDELKYYDLQYYSRKYKEENYQIDDEKIKEYFEFNHVLSRMFDFVEKIFDIKMRQIKTDNMDQMCYEVYYGWKQISYFILDPFYRKWKRSWAWANLLREKSDVSLPIVINLLNLSRVENWPILLTIRDCESLFHEFWHAIHAMIWKSKYAELSGFSVEWDFVELPSQLLENWVSDTESLEKLSKHYKTWETLPKDVLDKLDKLSTYGMWKWALRQNELALVDLNLYTSDIPNSVEELDKKILEIVNENSIFQRWEEYKMYCSFLHIFGWWYESKYYSYMRADQLQADIFSKIKAEWMMDPKVWKEYLEKILAQWALKPWKELFFDFMWRDVSEQALIEKYWLDSQE